MIALYDKVLGGPVFLDHGVESLRIEFFPEFLIQTVRVPELLGGAKLLQKVQISAQGTTTCATMLQTTDGRLMP